MRPTTLTTFNKQFIRSFHASKRVLALNFDPYATLGISKSADQAAVKRAYVDLVKKYHPDVNKEKDAETRFHKIQESYELLRDKNKRAQYDKYGASAFDANGNANPYAGDSNPFAGFGGGAGGGAQGNPFAGMGFDFEDLFRGAFSGRAGGQGGARGGAQFVTEHVGDNIEVLKSVSFKDAIFGTKVTINYKAVDTCITCSGEGLKKGAKKSTCPTCHGSGQTTHILGGFQMSSTCNTCQGAGVTIGKKDECNTCHGQGVREVPKSNTVDLPPGIQDGSRVRVPGEGDAPFITKDAYNRTRKGDLIIRVNVQRDPKFKRNGNDLVIDESVLMTTAALGGEIIVPTLDGSNVRLKVRPGVQSGRKLSIPNMGVPINRNMNNRGNLDVILNVKTLVPETATQTALLEALADAFNDKTAKRTHWKPADGEQEDEQVTGETYDEKDLNPGKLDRIGKFLGKFFNMEQPEEKDEGGKKKKSSKK
ncbi:DnaJ 1 mitochondrial [Spathaspora sp. JA1]|nr:DnaJ 1 mitochondrial [Spathaspora sp. JA1]